MKYSIIPSQKKAIADSFSPEVEEEALKYVMETIIPVSYKLKVRNTYFRVEDPILRFRVLSLLLEHGWTAKINSGDQIEVCKDKNLIERIKVAKHPIFYLLGGMLTIMNIALIVLHGKSNPYVMGHCITTFIMGAIMFCASFEENCIHD